MPLKDPAWKSADYSPVTDDNSSDEENHHAFQSEKARLYASWRSPTKKSLLFLVIPIAVSIGTVVGLLTLANLAYMHSHGGVHGGNSAPPAVVEAPHSHSHESHSYSHGYPPDREPAHSAPLGRSCGKTSEEARRNGCIFDTISFSWLVPECYDHELVEEFDKKIHTPFFKDTAGTMQATMDEVRTGDNSYYVPWEHHLWHCGFLWRKMHKSIMAGTPVDSYIGNYTHTEHCSAIMAGEIHGMEEVNTVMNLKFPYCGMGDLQWTCGTNCTEA